jgi:fucose permease
MPSAFVRDRLTWLAYLMLAYFAFLEAVLGPLVPFLRDELDLNYTVGGLHLSAFSVGMVIAGISADRLIYRWGRQRLFWGGGAGMALGAVLLVLGRHAALTIAGSFIMGLPGTVLLILIQSVLADRHGDQRATALTEANVLASVSAGLSPLLVGGWQRLGVGWRGAPLTAVLVWIMLALRFRREPIPTSLPKVASSAAPSTRLPALFWTFCLVIFLGVSVEWCVVFWGADFLETSAGVSRVNASSLLSVFFLAMVIGRFVGSRLTRAMPISRLLLTAILVATVGFVPFWLAPMAALNVAGLFIAGLGIANFFPLTMAAAINVVEPHQADRASGRIALVAGAAILITPQTLGALADQVGIKAAYSVAAVFLALALMVIVMARRREG